MNKLQWFFVWVTPNAIGSTSFQTTEEAYERFDSESKTTEHPIYLCNRDGDPFEEFTDQDIQRRKVKEHLQRCYDL